MALVVAIFGRVAPIARAFADSPAHGNLILDQFLGNVRFDRWRRAFAKVHPDQTEPFGDWVGAYAHPTVQWRIRPIRQTRDHDPGIDVVGPAVVNATPGARHLLATQRQWHATMRAAVLQRTRLAVLIAQQHDLVAEQREGERLAADGLRPGDRVPVVSKTEYRRVVRRPGIPLFSAKRRGAAFIGHRSSTGNLSH